MDPYVKDNVAYAKVSWYKQLMDEARAKNSTTQSGGYISKYVL